MLVLYSWIKNCFEYLRLLDDRIATADAKLDGETIVNLLTASAQLGELVGGNGLLR